jgi:hypothetical protein
MREYQSHKKVHAAQIKGVGDVTDAGVEVLLDDDTKQQLAREVIARYAPKVGDYLVRYADGYLSISPQQAFEDGYTPIYADAPKPNNAGGQT